MPPKRFKHHLLSDQKNPVVTLIDYKTKESKYYLHVADPPSAALYNNPNLSDITLKVGEQEFFAHKIIIAAASDVFARMVHSDWCKQSVMELQENEDCSRVFDKFLKYFYSGKILINKDYVFPLFLLADKYNVKGLVDECVLHIEKGLAVRSCMNKDKDMSLVGETSNASSTKKRVLSFGLLSSGDSESDSSDCDDSESIEKLLKIQQQQSFKCLIPCEIFPIAMVMKMLQFTHNEKIYDAALYNLEARLAKQVNDGDTKMWNLLDAQLLKTLLDDNHFYCSEYNIYKAVKSWLVFDVSRQESNTLKEVYTRVRFPLMNAEELYEVEADKILNECPDAIKLVHEAIRYKLFKDCPRAAASENWSGCQFTKRKLKS
ncbi:kelch-like protein 24a [Tubulanus polymorphus]|uniref:kelch-like protein 24a n=1 Tax=Tubulanus polymorphus TaxID=672921 RepID=UPI003DA5FD3D